MGIKTIGRSIMKKKNLCLLIFLLLSFLVLFSPYADRITLDDGRIIEGRIRNESGDRIIVETKGVEFTFPRSKVKKIEKLSEADNALLLGDELFASKKYGEAIKSYKEALKEKPEEAQVKIKTVESAIDELEKIKYEEKKKALATLPLEDQAKFLENQLMNSNLPEDEVSLIKSQLAQILLKQAEDAKDRIDFTKCQELLEKACTLSPETREIAKTYVSFMVEQNKNDPNLFVILKPYVMKHPDDLEILELFVIGIWKSDPGYVLKVLYSDNKLRPDVTEKIKALLPDILLACFNSQPYPSDAPFDAISCYEHLIAIKSDTSPLPLLKYKVRQNPNSTQAHFDLGNYYYKQGDWISAVNSFQKSYQFSQDENTLKILKSAKESLEKNYLEKAQQYLNEKKPEKAQEMCEIILSNIPDSKQAYELLQQVRLLARCETCQAKGIINCPECYGVGKISSIETYKEYEKINVVKISVRDKVFDAYQCKRCGGIVGFPFQDNMYAEDVNEIASKAKKCSCPNLKFYSYDFSGREKERTVYHNCSRCNGVGNLGTCSLCKGTGLVELQQPRATIIDISRLENQKKVENKTQNQP